MAFSVKKERRRYINGQNRKHTNQITYAEGRIIHTQKKNGMNKVYYLSFI